MKVTWNDFVIRSFYFLIRKGIKFEGIWLTNRNLLVIDLLVENDRTDARIDQRNLEIFDCEGPTFLLI